MQEFHEGLTGGHAGRTRTYHRIKRTFAWPGMLKDIKKFLAQCHTCQLQHYETTAPPGLLQPNPIPDTTWTNISMDFIDGLPNSEGCTII